MISLVSYIMFKHFKYLSYMLSHNRTRHRNYLPVGGLSGNGTWAPVDPKLDSASESGSVGFKVTR